MTAILERVQAPTLLRAAEVLDVSFPEGILDLLVIPYDKAIEVPNQFRSTPARVTETIRRGAFDGIQTRPNRVKAVRDHDETRAMGRAISFHPGDPAGLRAAVKISDTDLGRETLRLAADGVLDVSAAFRPDLPGGVRWAGAGSYQVTRAYLRHIALVAVPAYEDARVLAVRADPPPVVEPEPQPMPNLARLEYEQAQARYAAIDARYLR